MKPINLNSPTSDLTIKKPFDETLTLKWLSPSNIALVKYWGKYGNQLPKNASLSFTLSKSLTETEVFATYDSNQSNIYVEYYFENHRNKEFEHKILNYFKMLVKDIPFLQQLKFVIKSRNTFPHSAGIASSASSMSVLALIICDLENRLFGTLTNDKFYRKASYLARLGSGSASRSVFGGVSVWGVHPGLEDSSNEYAIPINDKIHPVFQNYHDSVLIVDAGIKRISSTTGHALMNDHFYAEQRFQQANKNLEQLMIALQAGNVNKFIKIVENEALSLHAMMMTSSESFMLLKPNTLHILEKIISIREQKGLDICFTLDAGPNVHLLYPEEIKNEVQDIINKELIVYCERNQWINDGIGNGPERLS